MATSIRKKLIMGCSLPLLLLFLVLLSLTQIPVADAGATTKKPSNKDKVLNVEPKNQTCYECSDELATERKPKSCSEFRDLWRKFVRAKKAHSGKSEYRNELLSILENKFGRRCKRGVEDCFYSRAEDVRIVGYEARGCGAGPRVIDAEPGEGCAKEQITYSAGKIDMINCVCDEDEDNYRGFCNKARGGLGSSLGILGIATLSLLMAHIL